MDSGTLAYETTLVARTEGFLCRWKEAERAEGRRSPKAETGRTSISACNRTLASARHTDKLCYQSRTSSIRSTVHLCTKPAADSGPTSVRRHQFHPPRTPLPRHKCAPLCEPRRQFGKVFRQDAV